MTYGRNETEKAVYTYGVQRVAEDDLQAEETSDYLYDGRGSVVQTAVAGAAIAVKKGMTPAQVISAEVRARLREVGAIVSPDEAVPFTPSYTQVD